MTVVAKRQGILWSMFYINSLMTFYDFKFPIRFLCTIKDVQISYILLSSSSEYFVLQLTAKMKSNFKVPWHLACGFALFWIILFFAVVIPLFYRLPTALTMEDAKKNEFIHQLMILLPIEQSSTSKDRVFFLFFR